jgi:hypothetical protein
MRVLSKASDAFLGSPRSFSEVAGKKAELDRVALAHE